MARRLRWIALLAALLQGFAVARSTLPAQDGLKFIRVARRFQAEPWSDVVRGTDRHPLYAALIALAEPAVEALNGPGPDAWRLAAQMVSALAAIGTLIPLYRLSLALFDEATATLAALLFVLLPLPAEVGHETLADALALLLTAWALASGERALRTGRTGPALACGLAAGFGFLTRPEVALVPVAVAFAATWTLAVGRWPAILRTSRARWPDPYRAKSRRPTIPRPPTQPSPTRGEGRILPPSPLVGEGWGGGSERAGTVRDSDDLPTRRPWNPYASPAAAGVLGFLVLVGGYALIKGQVSEKLALRVGAALPARPGEVRNAPVWLPAGLDDPRLDFSPKEESDAEPPQPIATAFGRVIGRWAEGLGWGLAPLALLGIWRGRASAQGLPGRRLVAAYVLLFGAALVRHVMTLGYLSGRHTLALVLVAVPWAAAGLIACARRLATSRGWDEAGRRRRRVVALATLIGLSVAVQSKAAHPSRWGHRQAGLWLAAHAGPADAVVDTRGWAAFVADRPAYDYWHVRQAFSDARLTYIVVGADELSAPSRRAETLRAVLAHAATPAADFPALEGGREVGVRIFRFRRPESWEGLRR